MKNTNHYGDHMNWVIKVIESCETNSQLKTAKKLTDVFENNIIKDSMIDIDLWRNISRQVRVAYDKKLMSFMK
jgi:hypothetical protein